MKTIWALGALGTVALAGAGLVVASPVPAEGRRPAAFPAGRYVLGGEKEAAKGDDVQELTKSFRMKPGQYLLSGGPSPKDAILVDDDLEVLQGGKPLFVDDDHVRSTETRGKLTARYQGLPIILVLDPTKKVQVRATDHCATEAVLGPIWVHRWDGASKKLTEGKSEESAPNLPNVFFDESFSLSDGFELPRTVSHDAEMDLPAKPASLLARFRSER